MVAFYTYDIDGKRLSKTTPNGTDNFLYNDITEVLAVQTGSSTKKFRGEPDEYGRLVSIDVDGTTYYYVYNGMGEIIGLTDSSGDYAVKYSYDSWGESK